MFLFWFLTTVRYSIDVFTLLYTQRILIHVDAFHMWTVSICILYIHNIYIFCCSHYTLFLRYRCHYREFAHSQYFLDFFFCFFIHSVVCTGHVYKYFYSCFKLSLHFAAFVEYSCVFFIYSTKIQLYMSF